ncbi:MAG TPA: P1 family peptidase [Bryobacteraceae bacterium]|nr:P1 family peptidase [Bryobacteraceae bacterium]
MRRREFNRSVAAFAAGSALSRRALAEENSGGITDVQGIKVGQFTDARRPTGCTVLLFEKGATAGVDVRGSAPGTRETDLLHPTNTVQQVQAILLSGGSAFGLDAASGVMRFLEERGLGIHVGAQVVPIVPAAILYDLAVGDSKIRPNADSGYKACESASPGIVAEGNVGAGAGATVGKMFGMKQAMKSGLGTASIRIPKTGVVVAAIVAVNAVGDVVDPGTGRIVAGARTSDGNGFVDTMAQIRTGHGVEMPIGANTTIGVVATNVAFDKTQMTKIAQMAQDGLARTINPSHTLADGDTIFAVATGASSVRANHGAVGALAADVMARAVVRAVLSAHGLPGLPSARDMLSPARG